MLIKIKCGCEQLWVSVRISRVIVMLLIIFVSGCQIRFIVGKNSISVRIMMLVFFLMLISFGLVSLLWVMFCIVVLVSFSMVLYSSVIRICGRWILNRIKCGCLFIFCGVSRVCVSVDVGSGQLLWLRLYSFSVSSVSIMLVVIFNVVGCSSSWWEVKVSG